MVVRTAASLLVLSALTLSISAFAEPVCVSQKGRLICQISETCLAEMSSAEENAAETSRLCAGDRAHGALSLNPTAVGEVARINASGQVTLRIDGTGVSMTRDYIEVARSLPALSGFSVGECVSVASAYGRGRVSAKVQALFSDNTVLLTTYGLEETRIEQVYRLQKNSDCSVNQ